MRTHGGHRRRGLLCGSRTGWRTSLRGVGAISRECERSARMGRETDQEDRRASCVVCRERVGRTDKAGGAASGSHTWWVRMTVGKRILGGYLRIWHAERRMRRSRWMISFLLKICAFLFATAHLSFLPHCQPHQPEQKLSVMPSNSERTYIMVKVRALPPLTSIAHRVAVC